MTETLKSFFDNLTANHWSTILFATLGLIFILYPIYFYFSKEGKDERGKKIIATASLLSFMTTIVLLFTVNNFLYDFITISKLACIWIINFITFIISGVQTLSILILKKRY